MAIFACAATTLRGTVHPANPILPAKPDARAASRLQKFLAEDDRALADRLLMYWNTHATDVFVRDQSVESVGGERAPEPTVAFCGHRGHVTSFVRPKVEELPRRFEDERGMRLVPKAGGDAQWVRYGDTGCMIESINCEILGLAKNAAFEYARGGDERYARLAWETLDTYLAGIYYRNVPTDLSHGHMQTLFGMQSMETIHDVATIVNLTALYDYMYDWTAKNHPDRMQMYQSALKKWAEVQIENGVADNNWDMMQLNNILDIAVVLESDSEYADGKGREHYIDVVMNQSSVRNLSVKKLAEKGFDPETGIWFECPGYSQVVLGDYATFAEKVKRLLGIDLFDEIPVLRKAFQADGEYLFPDGMIIGFGDTHPAPIKESIAKYGPLKPSPFFYAPNASWLISRSGMDAKNDIAFALNGALGNHMHANGISLELYAKGYRLGPDAGIGWTLYSGDDYQEYYGRWPAHNTVMVNSRSNHGIMKVFQPFKMLAHGEEWASVSYREPSGADQMRTFARVGSDYFVDCFRSRLGTGEDEWHDYYYHNFGDTLTLNGEVEPTEEIAFVESGLYALSYIKEKFARRGGGDLVAKFDWARPEGNVDMTVYMNDAENRTFIKSLAPATEGLSRCKNPNYGITKDSRTPCLVVRQRGEAWTRPFLAVFDPKGVVKSVEFGAQSITVVLKDGRTDRHEFTPQGLYVRTAGEAQTITSADGRLAASIDGSRASVSLDGREVVRISGFPAENARKKGEAGSFDRTWTNPFGECREVRDAANTLRIGHVEFRVYDGAFAWKADDDSGEYVFEFMDNAVCWPVSHAQGEYRPYGLNELGRQQPMPGFAPVAAGIGKMFNYDQKFVVAGSCEAPLVVEPKGACVAIGDAAVYGSARMRFVKGDSDREVRSYLEGPRKGDAPSWKYVRVASNPAELYNSGMNLLLNLSAPSKIEDVSFVKPGKCMRLAKLDTEVGKQAVDFIVANGLQYLEIDCGWYGQEHTGDPTKPGLAPERVAKGEKFDLFEILAYAKAKNVPVILYVNRAPLLKNHVVILDTLKSWGVAGVKYGFLHVGSAEARAWAFELIKAAAERGLLVDIHDEMRYTGEQRTYPNLMTAEGIRGNEEMPAANHNAALVFTRYLCGPGDYTPCWTVSRVKNTLAHQLAMPAVYFSPWQFLFWYQKPSDVTPSPALDFWREIPTVWDETRALDGRIGEYAVMARRSGDRWFVGGLNGESGQRTFKVRLDFLARDVKYSARLFKDGDPACGGGLNSVSIDALVADRTSVLEIKSARSGGFAMILTPEAQDVR